MTTPSGSKFRVAVICDPGSTLQQISAALNNNPEFELVDTLNVPDRLARELQQLEVDLIIIDHEVGGQPSLDIIDDLAAQFPNTEIVAILPSSDMLLAQQVTLAGAHAFLAHPFTQVNVLSTLRRVSELQARRRQLYTAKISSAHEGSRPIHVITVFSPRGGAGTSTIATNLAVALYNETQSRVLLMEGKLFFGHLDVMLNIRTRNSVSDLIPHASGLDDTLVHDVISEHISGIDVLLGPADIQFAQGIRTQDMYNVLTALQRMWDFIIIDAGNQLSEITVTMMDEADRILLVASPDLATLHDISRFKRISQSLAYPPEKTLLILNRADRPAGVKPKDIEAVLHQQLYALIPDDSINALRSLNRGIPLVINYPRSPASKAYKELARRLTSLGAESSATSATPTPASSPEPAPAQAQAKPAPAQAQAEPAPAQAQAEPAPVESTESVST